MVQIELDAIPAQTFQVLLDEQACTISIYQRDERLYLDLSVGEEVVANGCVCLERLDIIQYKAVDFSGHLYFYDTMGHTDPQWDGLEDRYIFIYISEDEEIPEILTADYIEDEDDG